MWCAAVCVCGCVCGCPPLQCLPEYSTTVSLCHYVMSAIMAVLCQCLMCAVFPRSFCVQSIRGLYGDATVEMDASVGVVMDTLRNFGLDNDTLVLFTRYVQTSKHNNGIQGTPAGCPVYSGTSL